MYGIISVYMTQTSNVILSTLLKISVIGFFFCSGTVCTWYACIYVCMFIGKCVCACGGLRLTLSPFTVLPILLKQGVLMKLELTALANLVS